MPLPAALAARLAKRGIITPDKAKHAAREDEEVIAEDYDEHVVSDLQQNNIINKHSGKLVTEDTSTGHLGCPNKWNVYHECSEACARRWGAGRDPEPKLELKRLQMLEKYPLPPTWSEVYDPGTGRYYYWNIESEMVSWLPPGHPRAMPGACASALRLQIQLLEQDKLKQQPSGEPEPTQADDRQMETDADGGHERDQDRDQDRERTRDRDHRRDRDRGDRDRDRRPRERDGKQRKRDDLDPMDPASYSDVPRGGWSSGLERDVKSGVDSTASGPLFQQRPYPSPGAVLRANAAAEPGHD